MFTPDPWLNDDGSLYFDVDVTDEHISVHGPAINNRARVFRAAGGVWDRSWESWIFSRSNERVAVKAILKVYGSIPGHLFEQEQYSNPTVSIALGVVGAAIALGVLMSLL